MGRVRPGGRSERSHGATANSDRQFEPCAGENRSLITGWRRRIGNEKLFALLRESPTTATRAGAAMPPDFCKFIVDITVQPKHLLFDRLRPLC